VDLGQRIDATETNQITPSLIAHPEGARCPPGKIGPIRAPRNTTIIIIVTVAMLIVIAKSNRCIITVETAIVGRPVYVISRGVPWLVHR